MFSRSWIRGTTREYEFLENYLLKIAKDAAFGGKRTDIMACVRLLTGEEEWGLFHIEIHGQDRRGSWAWFLFRPFAHHRDRLRPMVPNPKINRIRLRLLAK